MIASVIGVLASSPVAYAFQDVDNISLNAQPTPPAAIIYFHENDSDHDHAHDKLDSLLPSYEFTPRVGVLDALDQQNIVSPSGLIGGFTPRRANAHLDISYDRTAITDGVPITKRGFGFGLTSHVNQADALALGSTGNPMLDEVLRYESYELGVNVGYASLSFDASLYKELGSLPQSPLGLSMQGFDLGFSFNRPKWSTSLSVGSYRSLKDEFLAINEAGFQNSMTAFHLGAVYKPLPLLHLTGGIRYMDLSQNPYLLEPQDRQMFYLGTRLKF